MTLIVLVVLIVLLVVVLMQLFKKPAAVTPPRAGPDLANLKITDARAGDVISVSGAGDNLTDLDFTADRYTRFEAGAHPWFELSGPYRERRVSVRVAGDEEIEAAVHNDARKLTLEDLGVNEQDLSQMDERQNTADSFEFDSHVWYYVRSREVRASRDGGRTSSFYYWEFRERDGNRLLTIRKEEGEPFAVMPYTGIPVGDLTVYRGGPS
jgi:hypothetical protein